MQDPIADMLTRVRNSSMARQSEVDVPSSGIKKAIAEVLKSEGFINGYSVIEGGAQATLRIELKYRNSKPVIEGLKRVSRPSRRIYVPHDDIPKVMSGLGVNILSTPRGVISDRTARSQRVGGEIICAVW